MNDTDIKTRIGRNPKSVTGAIAGPLAALDLLALSRKNLTLCVGIFQQDDVFGNPVRHLKAGKIRSGIVRTCPLAVIARAQRDFLSTTGTGKPVHIPPQVTA